MIYVLASQWRDPQTSFNLFWHVRRPSSVLVAKTCMYVRRSPQLERTQRRMRMHCIQPCMIRLSKWRDQTKWVESLQGQHRIALLMFQVYRTV